MWVESETGSYGVICGQMKSAGQAFLSKRIVTAAGMRAGAVLVQEGRIQEICALSQVPGNYAIRDYGNLAILPGLVDSHVHINEPGRTDWEGFWTATRAAAAGGYTTLVDMPLNCLPETTTVDALETKRSAAAGKCFVDWAAWGGVAGENALDIEPMAQAGVRGFKAFLVHPGCDGFQMVTLKQLESALPHVAATRLPLLVHAELQGPIDAAAPSLADADWRSYATYLRSRPDDAEVSAIHLLIDLCRTYQFRLHIVHLSSARALPLLRQARVEGLPVSVETCPHYLYFAAENIPDGSTLHKCAPPIRDRANQQALWQALIDGEIDMVATDHSPCPPALKRLDEGRFDMAWGGIAGIQTALSAMWTGLLEHGLGLEETARLLSQKPAELAGLTGRKGAIAKGMDADMVIFDPEEFIDVDAHTLYTRHTVTPYSGQRVRGKVVATYLRGQLVFGDGNFSVGPLGQEL